MKEIKKSCSEFQRAWVIEQDKGVITLAYESDLKKLIRQGKENN